MLYAWENAWNSAQPHLSSITTAIRAPSTVNPRVIRVGQLDSELLDQQLVQLLQEPINKALSLINNSLRANFELELTLLIQLTLYKLSVWNTGASYGAKLQDLKFFVPSTSSHTLSSSRLPRRTLLNHIFLTLIVPYVHSRLRSHALSRAWPDAPSSDRRRKAWNVLNLLESTHTLFGLVNFVAFLWGGQYRTLADRFLKMKLVPARRSVKRDVSYEFMNRQMVWHAFTEFLLFLLPLLNARSIRRRFYRLASNASLTHLFSLLPEKARGIFGIVKDLKSLPTGAQRTRGKFWSLPEDQCGICAENASFNPNLSEPANMFTVLANSPTGLPSADPLEPPAYPIFTPYVTSCGHVYCYHCIAERMLWAVDEAGNGQSWECIRCGADVKRAERLSIKVFESDPDSECEFSSDLEMITDMSGSLGSYSESVLSE